MRNACCSAAATTPRSTVVQSTHCRRLKCHKSLVRWVRARFTFFTAICAAAAAPASTPERPPLTRTAASSVIKPGSVAYVTLYAFNGTQKGQLTFAKGDVLKVYNQDKSDWWKAINVAGTKGWAPAKYLERASLKQSGM